MKIPGFKYIEKILDKNFSTEDIYRISNFFNKLSFNAYVNTEFNLLTNINEDSEEKTEKNAEDARNFVDEKIKESNNQMKYAL